MSLTRDRINLIFQASTIQQLFKCHATLALRRAFKVHVQSVSITYPTVDTICLTFVLDTPEEYGKKIYVPAESFDGEGTKALEDYLIKNCPGEIK